MTGKSPELLWLRLLIMPDSQRFWLQRHSGFLQCPRYYASFCMDKCPTQFSGAMGPADEFVILFPHGIFWLISVCSCCYANLTDCKFVRLCFFKTFHNVSTRSRR